MLLGMLALFCMVTRIWPLLFLVIPGILIYALRTLSVSAKKDNCHTPPPAMPPYPPRPVSETDVVRMAFGILQWRIAEQVSSRFPEARWVWECPDAIQRFADGLQLTILLNRAGGFQRAAVQLHNLRFCSLVYETAEPSSPPEPPPDMDSDGDTGLEDIPNEDETIDYALIAFQWVEANMLMLNNRCNDAIAGGQLSILIPSHDLPHHDSWPDICSELERNGFIGADARMDGINLSIPEQKQERE